MSDMPPEPPAHAKPRRAGWLALRFVIVALGVLLAPVFFLDMFMTVTHLLRPSFGGWAWTVPAATEGSFVVLYLLDLLLEWAGKPMGWLRFAPYPFAAASLLLNVYASRGNLPGMVGHGVVTVAFFLPLLAGEAAVRSLSVSDNDVRLAAAMADARQHAVDLCRDRKGIFWRWGVPALLRRQILAGRLPDEVREAVKEKVSDGATGGWEAAVRTWVFRELNISVQAAKADREAVASITSGEPETVPEASPEPLPAALPKAPRERAPDYHRKPSAKAVREMSGEALAPWVRAWVEEGNKASIAGVRDHFRVGDPKARAALTAAGYLGTDAEVLQIGAR